MPSAKKASVPMNNVENKDKLSFEFLPAFARYILDHHLDTYVSDQIRFSREEEVPLLKLFAQFTDEQLLEMGKISSGEFLTSIAENKATAYIEKSTSDFVKNQIPFLERGEVVAEDITSISFVRRKTLRKILKGYTEDFNLFSCIMEEVDRFIAESETGLFKAYLDIQQEGINEINVRLATREQELLEAQDLAGMGSFLWRFDGGKSSFTPGLMNVFQMEQTSNLESFMEDVHEDDRQMLREAIERGFSGDGIYECEYRFIKNNIEKKIWLKGIVTYHDGKPLQMKGTVMDVTNKHTMLDKLKQSEELHKQAQALTHIGNWTWDMQTNKIDLSDEMYRIYGLEPQSEEIQLERFLSFIHPEDREKRMAEIQDSIRTLIASDYQIRIITPAGKVKVLQGKGQVITNNKKEAIKISGTCQDITREYNLNKHLKEKEEYLNQIITNAPDAVIVIDANSKITLWNPKTEEIFGWKAAEVLGENLAETIIPPQYREAHKKGMNRMMNTGVATILNKSIEITALNKAGEEFYISLTISQSIQQGHRLFIAFIRDISKEIQNKAELATKTTELESLNNSLEFKNMELERMNKELESFNYIASHDLQEPLRKIQLFTNRIIEKNGKQLSASAIEYLEKISSSSARMKTLIEDLLIFSQSIIKEENFEHTNLNLILDEVKTTLAAMIEDKKVIIESEILPVLRVVPFQFQQVMLNLIVNAIKYTAEDKIPHIKISCAIIPGKRLNLPGRSYCEIKISDNGIGFEQSHAENIFKLFHRLHHKDEYSGTGIGLAICKKIIQNHQGFITAKSTPGKGSDFYIYMPHDPVAQKKNQLAN